MVKTTHPLKAAWQASASNSKDTFISPENMENNGTYAFTYNPQEQPRHDLAMGFKEWWSDQLSMFKSFKGASLRLFLEVSKTGRHHFHGFLYIKNRVNFVVFDVPKLQRNGSSKVEAFAYKEGENMYDHHALWLAYCLKIQPDMQEYIHDQLYPKTNNKLDPDIYMTMSPYIYGSGP